MIFWIILTAGLALALVVLYCKYLDVIDERKLLIRNYSRACTQVADLSAEVEALRSKRRRAQRAAVLGLIEGELND